jgi:hypothetical protein
MTLSLDQMVFRTGDTLRVGLGAEVTLCPRNAANKKAGLLLKASFSS